MCIQLHVYSVACVYAQVQVASSVYKIHTSTVSVYVDECTHVPMCAVYFNLHMYFCMYVCISGWF